MTVGNLVYLDIAELNFLLSSLTHTRHSLPFALAPVVLHTVDDSGGADRVTMAVQLKTPTYGRLTGQVEPVRLHTIENPSEH